MAAAATVKRSRQVPTASDHSISIEFTSIAVHRMRILVRTCGGKSRRSCARSQPAPARPLCERPRRPLPGSSPFVCSLHLSAAGTTCRMRPTGARLLFVSGRLVLYKHCATGAPGSIGPANGYFAHTFPARRQPGLARSRPSLAPRKTGHFATLKAARRRDDNGGERVGGRVGTRFCAGKARRRRCVYICLAASGERARRDGQSDH